MTIHHDKLAYGKLAPTREDLSEQKLDEMLKRLAEEDKTEEDEKAEEDGEKQDKKDDK